MDLNINDSFGRVKTASTSLEGTIVAEATLASQSNGAGDKLSVSVVGDGVTPVILEHSSTCITTGAAGTNIFVMLRDGASGGGNLYGASYFQVYAPNTNHNFTVQSTTIPPWLGTKTFYVNLNNSSGTPLMYGQSDSAPAFLRVRRAKLHTLSTDASDQKAILTTLPASAADGTVIFYATSTMQSIGVIWQLRYNASSSSAYKWEFVGGPPIASMGGGGNVSTGGPTTYGDPAGGTGAVTIPLSGDYSLCWSARIVNNSSGNTTSGFAGITRSGSSILMSEYYTVSTLNLGNSYGQQDGRINAATVGDVFKFQMGTNGGINTNVYQPTVSVTPIRVG